MARRQRVDGGHCVAVVLRVRPVPVPPCVDDFPEVVELGIGAGRHDVLQALAVEHSELPRGVEGAIRFFVVVPALRDDGLPQQRRSLRVVLRGAWQPCLQVVAHRLVDVRLDWILGDASAACKQQRRQDVHNRTNSRHKWKRPTVVVHSSSPSSCPMLCPTASPRLSPVLDL